MQLDIKLYGILVTDNDEILLKNGKKLSLPGRNIILGNDLTESIKTIIREDTNVNLVDIILFDQKSIIEENTHTLGIFFIGTFYKKDIERINQNYKWCKIKKIDYTKVDEFSKFIIEQIISN